MHAVCVRRRTVTILKLVQRLPFIREAVPSTAVAGQWLDRNGRIRDYGSLKNRFFLHS